jgi:hypothetical protein
LGSCLQTDGFNQNEGPAMREKGCGRLELFSFVCMEIYDFQKLTPSENDFES